MKKTLFEKTVETINNIKNVVRKCNIQEKSDDMKHINEVLYNYDHHTRISKMTGENNSTERELDKLPEIKTDGDRCYIHFPSINGPYIDYMNAMKKKKGNVSFVETSYKTKRGKIVKQIIDMTRKAIHNATNIEIDFRDCGGGHLDSFLLAFQELITDGLMIYFNKSNYCIFNGKHAKWVRKIPTKYKKNADVLDNKHITIYTNEWTGSSGEILPVVISSCNKYCKILCDDEHTAGYLTITNQKKFKHNGDQYMLSYTLSDGVYDRNDKYYAGYLV